jgi:hypothetical protein
MTKYEVLTEVKKNQIKPQEAYQMMYHYPKERKPKKANWVKVKIRIPESKGVSILLAVLLALPIHIGIIKWIVSKRANRPISDQFQFTPKELLEMIAIKGVKVNIHTKTNEKILIATI